MKAQPKPLCQPNLCRTIRTPEVQTFRSNDLEADRDNRPWLAPRGDTAVCNYSRKAKRPQAAVWNSDQVRQAVADLRRDYTASSAKGPNASLLRTWESMHRRMNEGRNDCYPLTCEKITKVAAAFKACGYRSFANYLSRAKEVHISHGGVWSEELNMEGRRAVRSVTRGIGPVLQRTPLDIEQIIQYQTRRPLRFPPVVDEGPVGIHTLVVLGCYFMLREAEASLLLLANVSFDRRRMWVTIKLPSSKTDPAAASVDRSWGCLCKSRGPQSCPYHLANDHARTLHMTFSHSHDMQCLPFFPTESGTTVEKTKVVESFEMLHERLGLPLVDENGSRLLGGHSMRLAGSRMLASSGLHLYQIELMARWKSPMLIHYAQSAPLTTITKDLEEATARRSLSDQLELLRQEMGRLERETKQGHSQSDLTDRLQQLESTLGTLDDRTRDMIKDQCNQFRLQLLDKPTKFVRNSSSGVWHSVSIDGLGHTPGTWATVCGWRFGLSHFTRGEQIPHGCRQVCDKCLPKYTTSSSDSSEDSSD